MDELQFRLLPNFDVELWCLNWGSAFLVVDV